MDKLMNNHYKDESKIRAKESSASFMALLIALSVWYLIVYSDLTNML